LLALPKQRQLHNGEREGFKERWGGKLTVSRAGLALAVIAVVIAREERRVHIHRVLDQAAEAVTRENHFGYLFEILFTFLFDFVCQYRINRAFSKISVSCDA
jgi:hypothetical protein